MIISPNYSACFPPIKGYCYSQMGAISLHTIELQYPFFIVNDDQEV
jgi:hypothetical protein